MADPANLDQAAGEHRIAHAALLDEEVRLHNERFRAVADIGRADRVLDIGCGTGQSTREAARAASDGQVLGVDISAGAIELARRASRAEGLINVDYEVADAQTHEFAPARFDVCISRFGAMFFADPDRAFANFGRAVRPDGRLVLLVWQARERNEWPVAIRQAIAPGVSPFVDDGPDPFTLGDPATTRDLLTAAGFADVDFVDVHEPVYYGPDAGTATELVLGFHETKQSMAGLEPEAAGSAVERLRGLIAAHRTERGVLFDSRAWIVKARRA
jgi:SAM-dependent methyltransferase